MFMNRFQASNEPASHPPTPSYFCRWFAPYVHSSGRHRTGHQRFRADRRVFLAARGARLLRDARDCARERLRGRGRHHGQLPAPGRRGRDADWSQLRKLWGAGAGGGRGRVQQRHALARVTAYRGYFLAAAGRQRGRVSDAGAGIGQLQPSRHFLLRAVPAWVVSGLEL